METRVRKLALVRALVVAAAALSFCGLAHGAPKYQVLHAFGKANDGAGLWCSLLLDPQHNLYGTTSGGGRHNGGTAFRLMPHPGGIWAETLVHSFPSFPADGGGPNGGLILDPAGRLYGTTLQGGPQHDGTVFELADGGKGWRETMVHAGGSWASVTRDGAGDLFGTTETSVFELIRGSHGWHKTVLHQFTGGRDGGGAFAAVILDAEGNVYGATESGGVPCGSSGCGVVYEIEHGPNGWHEKVLHYFDNNGKDGVEPGVGALFMDGTGSLYGTTAGGGCCGGVVFKLTPQSDGRWKETILYQFQGGANGFEPGAGVVMDKAGNLYGTTIAGGSGCGCGVVYELSPGAKGKWTYTVLHTFTGNDGAQPDANLILDEKGNLYGTTATGGAYGGGVVFEITP
jgi:uncharacterized repeat protein (TIGR03803 family)